MAGDREKSDMKQRSVSYRRGRPSRPNLGIHPFADCTMTR